MNKKDINEGGIETPPKNKNWMYKPAPKDTLADPEVKKKNAADSKKVNKTFKELKAGLKEMLDKYL
jgi:hypothetical protein